MRGRLGQQRLDLGEGLAEARVEAPADLPRELQMLHLILAHGDAGGVVEQDIRRLQHRIGEQTRGHELMLTGLGLELGHALEFAVGSRGGLKDPGQLGVFGHLGLREEDALLRVEAAGEEIPRHLHRPVPEGLRVVVDGDGVVVHHAVDALEVRPDPAATPSFGWRRGSCRGEESRWAGFR